MYHSLVHSKENLPNMNLCTSSVEFTWHQSHRNAGIKKYVNLGLIITSDILNSGLSPEEVYKRG